MTIDEAIKKLGGLIDYPQYPVGSEDVPAIKLGIQALKWISSNRDAHWHRCNKPLPGETKD